MYGIDVYYLLFNLFLKLQKKKKTSDSFVLKLHDTHRVGRTGRKKKIEYG